MDKARFTEAVVSVYGGYPENDSYVQEILDRFAETDIRWEWDSLRFAKYLRYRFPMNEVVPLNVRVQEFVLYMTNNEE